jgi:hypothetical protein
VQLCKEESEALSKAWKSFRVGTESDNRGTHTGASPMMLDAVFWFFILRVHLVAHAIVFLFHS